MNENEINFIYFNLKNKVKINELRLYLFDLK